MNNFNNLDSKIIKLAGITVMIISLIFNGLSCNSQQKTTVPGKPVENKVEKYKVTFVELGSVRCIPCQQMQPVMKSIEQKYGTEVKVVFHDVWTEAGAPYGKEFKIEAIPTQIFLDENGKEYYRHVGFFPEEELVKVLEQKGVKVK